MSMVLGSVTFGRTPSDMTIIKKDRITASVDTYSSAAVFSWGATNKGKTVDIYWPYMELSLWDSLQGLVEADATIVFNPDDNSGKTYNCEILSLDGKYHINTSTSGSNIYRKDIKLTLKLLSEVAS
jgi:hypothetical protein